LSWEGLKRGAVACRLNMTETGSKLSLLSQASLDKILAIAHSDRKNVMLYDAVAKEIFFSKGVLFVEGSEDANILRSYVEENGLTYIEIFGYGSGGAPNIIHWLTMCDELGIRAFGLYDGDAESSKRHAIARIKFADNSMIAVDQIWTPDIRDKPDDNKEGLFDEHWKIKGAHEDRLDELLRQISRHIGG
jgi:predicted ATP-dependent endonuclease of OLD family